MASSFSRFLDDEELQKVRELYLQSLQEEGESSGGGPMGPAGTLTEAQPGGSDLT